MAGPIKIPIILQNVGQAAGMVGGAAAGAAGAAASQSSNMQRLAFGAGGPSEITKGLGQIAKQLPGAGMMETMAGAFKQGGPIGVMTAGISGMLGFVKQILESSKVFQGIAGSFFKIFGAMADVFLLPFLPLAMKGMQKLLEHMPKISEWGEKAAGWLEKVFNFFREEGWSGFLIIGKEIQDWFADEFPGHLVSAVETIVHAIIPDWILSPPKKKEPGEPGESGKSGILNLLGPGLSKIRDTLGNMPSIYDIPGMPNKPNITKPELPGIFKIPGTPGAGISRGLDILEKLGVFSTSDVQDKQLGGRVPGGAGQGVPTILHGGEEIIPRDVVQAMEAAQGGVLGGFFGTMGEQIYDQAQKINTYVQEFKTKEGSAGGTIATFDATVLEGDIPNIWNGIDDYLSGIGSQTRNAANAARQLDISGLADDFNLNIELPEFKPPTEALNEIVICFETLQTCINANLEAMPAVVEGQVSNVQKLISQASNLIAEGDPNNELGPVMDALLKAMGNLGATVSTVTTGTTEELQLAAKSLSDVWTNEIAAWGETFYGNTAQFGAALSQTGVFLANRAETMRQPKPCTSNEKEDPTNERCWEGCQPWMKTIPGHPCYVKPQPQFYTQGPDVLPPRPPEPEQEPDIEVIEEIVKELIASPPENQFTGISTMLNAEAKSGFTLGTPTSVATREQAIQATAASLHAGGGTLPGPMGAAPDLATSMEMLGIQSIGRSGVMHFAFDPDEFYSGGIVPGRHGASRLIRAHGGERIIPNSASSGGTQATSNRVMNVTVNARGGLAEVLGELQRFEDMDEASFFNSVL